MGYPNNTGTFYLGPWLQGLNNVEPPERLSGKEFSASANMVLDEIGVAETRPGTAVRISATTGQGLKKISEFEGLYFDEGKLYRMDVRSWTKTELASGYAKDKRISWAIIGSRAYFTNGTEHGRVHLPTWAVLEGFGTPAPEQTVTLSALAYGNLPIGRYFVSFTYIDAYGEESASPKLHFIELTAAGGINVALSGTVPSSVDAIRVYLTEVNGKRDELYRVVVLDTTDTSVQLTTRAFGSPLSTLFLEEIPVPDLITAYNGCLYFSVEDRVWHSDHMRYGLYHIRHNEIGWFSEDVSVLERSPDGIFVVADSTYAFVGSLPKEFVRKDNVLDARASKFSGKQVEGRLFKKEGIPDQEIPMWFSRRGPVLGLSEGRVFPLTKGRAEPDAYAKGASGMVEFNGVNAALTAVDEFGGQRDSLSLQDSFSVRVVNRGISE